MVTSQLFLTQLRLDNPTIWEDLSLYGLRAVGGNGYGFAGARGRGRWVAMGEAGGQEADDGDGGADDAERRGRRRRIALAVVGVCLAGVATAVIGVNALQPGSGTTGAGTTGAGAAPTASGGERQWRIMIPPVRITGSDSGTGLPEPWNSVPMAALDVNPQTESVCHIYRVFELFLNLRKDDPVGDPTGTSMMTRQLRELPQLIQTSAHRTGQFVADADALAAFGAAPGFPGPDSLTSSPVRALKKDCLGQPTS